MSRSPSKILLIICGLLTVTLAQEPADFRRDLEPEIPNFIYDVSIMPIVTRDSIKIDIIIKVPYSAIQFVKKDTIFIGKYEISVMLLDEKEVNAISKIWTRALQTTNFEETYSNERYDINTLTYKVKPSDYSLTIGVMDLDTRKTTHRKRELNLKNYYKKSITLSSINIIEDTIADSSGDSTDVSSLNGTLSNKREKFDISFFVLSGGGKGTIKYSIYNMNKKVVLEDKIDHNFKKGIDHQRISIPRHKLSYSKYRLVLTVKIGSEEVKAEKIIQIRWAGMSDMIYNLDDAIDQLRYIARGDVISKMKKASGEEKKNLFLEFWRERDPTPGTEENELMNEYYRRVAYANQNFSGYLEGWKTDMGMIYILFGPPNDIERHPFEIQTKPYEIWYYYELNRTFIFVDETGFGEYRLITPLNYYGSFY
ncbi:MAG TPA: GWxTD domain-containing protein [Candidatus Marinimicrobia bacterium]|nr:GWxTD domain-containing protein [Candidatus Neomarinimicrobiota bacterium]HRS52073.1 GWxTD domain-containing protein [Candidatus Neomarinimicrobiota bacterium]HRU93065.1 GWxTD domain-containing protein [Candidatus Neomarinimicrobiota bacterium]